MDPYLYPGTDVLTNRFGIREAERLARLERVLTRLKGQDRLHDLPMTARGFYAVHKHLMGDVYAWAGQARTIDMHLAGHRGQVLAEFEPAGRIKPGLHRLFAELKRDHYLAGSSVDRFAARAAHYVAELNRIHPFRDGNGRTMRVWLRELAAQAGHRLALARFERNQWIEASIAAHGSSREQRPMIAAIHGAIVGREQEGAATLPYGPISIEAARLAVLRHLDGAIEQASGRVAAFGAIRQVAGSAELKGDHLKAVKIANWLGSREDGPMQRLEILRAAGVQTISLPPVGGKTDLERVVAIGKASQQALKELPPRALARARGIALGRTRDH